MSGLTEAFVFPHFLFLCKYVQQSSCLGGVVPLLEVLNRLFCCVKPLVSSYMQCPSVHPPLDFALGVDDHDFSP